jgi:hypothetical protein
MRRLELRFSVEDASAAVLDHVAKSVACIGIGVMAGHPIDECAPRFNH